MIIFSMLCLLKAVQPLPMEPVLDQHGRTLVGVFKTQKLPPEIVAFSATPDQGEAKREAEKYAVALHNYKLSERVIRIANPTDTYAISSYERTVDGWMIHHKDVLKKKDFVSYVVSAEQNWAELQKTIDTTLACFMRGYTAAFPTLSPKENFDPQSYARTTARPTFQSPTPEHQRQLAQDCEQFIPRIITEGTTHRSAIALKRAGTPEKKIVEDAYKAGRSVWSRDIWQRLCQDNPYNALFVRTYVYQKRQEQESMDTRSGTGESQKYYVLGDFQNALDSAIDEWYLKLLNANRPQLTIASADSVHTVRHNLAYETGISAQREQFDALRLEQKYQKLEQHFNSVMQQPFVYLQRLHQFPHGWGGNNCLFLALSAHPQLLQEVIDLLWGAGSDKPNVLNTPYLIDQVFPGLGIQLRQKFQEWLTIKQNEELCLDPETGRKITVKQFIIGIHPGIKPLRASGTTDESIFINYIQSEMTGIQLMAAELYDVLSIYLKRRIISVTGPYGQWSAPLVTCQSPRLDQIDVKWRPEVEAPTVYALTCPESHHWAARAHLVS